MQEETEGGSGPFTVPDATVPGEERAGPAGGARDSKDWGEFKVIILSKQPDRRL